MGAFTRQSQHTLLYLLPVSVPCHIYICVRVCEGVPDPYAGERPYLEMGVGAVAC
jgi:hypothetical protein